MKKNILLYIFLLILPAVFYCGNSLDALMSPDNKKDYEGYTLHRLYPEGKYIFYGLIALKKGEEIVRLFPKVEAFKEEKIKEQTSFGFLNLLKKAGKKEIIVKASLNGDINKYFYWVYALEPELRLVFDTEKWKTGYYLSIDDMDNDNVKELIQTNLTFDEFDRCSHANSAVFDIIFKYDAEKGEYLPANFLFKQMVATDDWGKQPVTNRDRGGAHLGSLMKKLLPLIYSGQEKEGWKYFEREYNLADKWVMIEKMKKKLEEDPVYQYIKVAAPAAALIKEKKK